MAARGITAEKRVLCEYHFKSYGQPTFDFYNHTLDRSVNHLLSMTRIGEGEFRVFRTFDVTEGMARSHPLLRAGETVEQTIFTGDFAGALRVGTEETAKFMKSIPTNYTPCTHGDDLGSTVGCYAPSEIRDRNLKRSIGAIPS